MWCFQPSMVVPNGVKARFPDLSSRHTPAGERDKVPTCTHLARHFFTLCTDALSSGAHGTHTHTHKVNFVSAMVLSPPSLPHNTHTDTHRRTLNMCVCMCFACAKMYLEKKPGEKEREKGDPHPRDNTHVCRLQSADPLFQCFFFYQDIKVPEHVISGLKVQRLGT